MEANLTQWAGVNATKTGEILNSPRATLIPRDIRDLIIDQAKLIEHLAERIEHAETD